MNSKKKIQRILRREAFIAAISPEGNCYHEFATIPTIKPPRSLILRKSIIIADGWLIRVVRSRSFLDLISRQAEAWNVQGPDGYRQVSGFLDALEQVLLADEPEGQVSSRFIALQPLEYLRQSNDA